MMRRAGTAAFVVDGWRAMPALRVPGDALRQRVQYQSSNDTPTPR